MSSIFCQDHSFSISFSALVKKRPKLAKTANHVIKMYFSATHEEFAQKTNPCRETISGSGQWETKCLVKEHYSQTGQNLPPKTELSRTK